MTRPPDALSDWLSSPLEGDLVTLLRALPDARAFLEAWARLREPEAALRLADAHALRGPLRAALIEVEPDPARRAELQREAAEARLRHTWSRAALGEASATLSAAGIAHALLKGPLLAEEVYPDPGQRVALDLDLLVASADLERALTALRELGYHSEDGPWATYARAHHVHLHLARADRPLIELHFRAFRGFGIELSTGPLLARSQRSSLDEVRVLEPHDRFLYLALHATGHLFERLGWLYDLKLFLQRVTLDPGLLAARAEESGGAAALALTCAALEAVAPESETLGALRPLLPPPRRLVSRIRRAHQAGPRDTPRATLERIAFQALLAPTPPAGARFLAHHLGRIARRRIQRRLPTLTPPEWAG